jgi:hypothetical protein
MLEKDAVNCFLRALIHSPFDRQQDCDSQFSHKYGYFAQNLEKSVYQRISLNTSSGFCPITRNHQKWNVRFQYFRLFDASGTFRHKISVKRKDKSWHMT